MNSDEGPNDQAPLFPWTQFQTQAVSQGAGQRRTTPMSGTATGRLRQPVALEHMYERQLLADMGHLEDQYESLRASEKEEHVRLVDAQQQLQDFATQREEALRAAAAAEAGTREMKAFVGGSFVFFLVFCACAHGCDPARFRESYNPQGASDANALLHVAMKDAPNKSVKDERQGQPLETPRTTEAGSTAASTPTSNPSTTEEPALEHDLETVGSKEIIKDVDNIRNYEEYKEPCLATFSTVNQIIADNDAGLEESKVSATSSVKQVLADAGTVNIRQLPPVRFVGDTWESTELGPTAEEKQHDGILKDDVKTLSPLAQLARRITEESNAECYIVETGSTSSNPSLKSPVFSTIEVPASDDEDATIPENCSVGPPAQRSLEVPSEPELANPSTALRCQYFSIADDSSPANLEDA